MEDRFKQKVWKVSTKEMFELDSIKLEGSNIYSIDFYDDEWELVNDKFDLIACSQDGDILRKCTGLKDKNGKLIYEGDIMFDGGYIYETVIFKNGCMFLYENEGYDPTLLYQSLEHYTVAGNIYENKKLLNKEV